MAIGTITGSEFVSTLGDAATRDCPVPAGTGDGDILVAYCVLSQDDAAATGIASTGWTSYPFAQATGIGRTAVLIKAYNASTDPPPVTGAFTFTKIPAPGSSGTFAVVMIKVPGANATPAVAPTNADQVSPPAPINDISCPGVTVPAGLSDQAVVIRFYHTYYYLAAKNNTDTWTPPAGFTEQADQSDDWCSIGASTLLSGAGAVAPANAVASGNTGGAYGRGVTLVLAPTAVATGPEPGRRMLLGVS